MNSIIEDCDNLLVEKPDNNSVFESPVKEFRGKYTRKDSRNFLSLNKINQNISLNSDFTHFNIFIEKLDIIYDRYDDFGLKFDPKMSIKFDCEIR